MPHVHKQHSRDYVPIKVKCLFCDAELEITEGQGMANPGNDTRYSPTLETASGWCSVCNRLVTYPILTRDNS